MTKMCLLAAVLLSPMTLSATTLEVSQAYARATPPNAVTSAVFATISNHDNQDHSIVAALTPAAGKAELHDVITEGDMMKMRQVTSFKLPAGGSLQLKPGSFHIMLFDLPQPLMAGMNIEVELQLENGDHYRFDAPVKKVMAGMHQH
ncbi:copper chaperone PCu(A)C [Vibrio sp. H11]|uniref:copper chaperone PCu(A)C n=1 Tax=Vibrio sp. H11 TaxID=2565928 RepID=UPI0010A5FCF6|nr:copper chaperone PCu(A)C [Vibrio sp. H11]